jgi:beta-phosphoglucomutase-like phosphatase (HAD superfamily)
MKPAPDIYLAAAEKLDVAPKSCCVIEDSINGIRAAKAAGMRCVAVAQSFAASELQAAAPDCIRPGVSSISLADLGLKDEM